jgi:alcohol dehydrogenase (NADP+)
MGKSITWNAVLTAGSDHIPCCWYEFRYSFVDGAVGHEIVGDVVRIGSKVSLIKQGQRVGVGAEALSCFTCAECKSDNEQYCSSQVETYNSRYADGTPAYGGFANYVRVHEK